MKKVSRLSSVVMLGVERAELSRFNRLHQCHPVAFHHANRRTAKSRKKLGECGEIAGIRCGERAVSFLPQFLRK